MCVCPRERGRERTGERELFQKSDSDGVGDREIDLANVALQKFLCIFSHIFVVFYTPY